jgi:DNA repair protein RadA/Sms
VRSVANLELRLREARRLGFVRAVVPKYALKQIETQEFAGMELLGVAYVRQAVQLL